MHAAAAPKGDHFIGEQFVVTDGADTGPWSG